MSGLGLILSIARDALAAQQYGINVTGHNIANVNTEGYSRQTSVNEAREPAPYGGLLLGRGVDVTQVLRASDQFIESQLMDRKSDMSTSQELENYMQVMEGLFNENSETSISMIMSKFWNLWQDIANNPSGSTERVALYEHSILMSDQFKTLNTDLIQIQTDLTRALSGGIVQINEITNEIAQVNGRLVGMEAATSIANDLRDKRNTLTSELAQYLDVKTFEQTNGSLTIITAKGCVLVHGNDNYNLVPGGDNGDKIMWEGKDGVATGDITNNITRGKMGGWLEMRDEIIEKYKLDLNAMAEEFIWAVNQQHSQGVGLELFQPSSSVTGSYKTIDTLGDLKYGGAADGYVDYSGTFKLWIGDGQGENLQDITIDLDSGFCDIEASSSLANLCDSISAQIIDQRPLLDGKVVASLSASGDAIVFTTDESHTLGFADDTSNILAALGINIFFTGVSAGGMSLNNKISLDKNYIAAARIDADGNFASGDNTNALAIADLQYMSIDISLWTCDRIDGNTEGSLTATIDNYYHSMVSSIGIKSSSISRSRAFNAVMANKIGEIRDSISAVSLDEEMTNIIKFQRAFQAAAKLISISDEMLNTLLSVK